MVSLLIIILLFIFTCLKTSVVFMFSNNNQIDKLMHQNNLVHKNQAIIIGAQKCGSGALLTFLKFHPLVKTSLKPDYFTNYFNSSINYYK